VAAVLALGACGEEPATPIDLRQGRPAATTTPGPVTPHPIGENPQARAHAERQCREDADLDQGVISIVDPRSDKVVGVVVVDCDELRRAEAAGASGS
jgi:hypothetical protein